MGLRLLRRDGGATSRRLTVRPGVSRRWTTPGGHVLSAGAALHGALYYFDRSVLEATTVSPRPAAGGASDGDGDEDDGDGEDGDENDGDGGDDGDGDGEAPASAAGRPSGRESLSFAYPVLSAGWSLPLVLRAAPGAPGAPPPRALHVVEPRLQLVHVPDGSGRDDVPN